MDPSDDGFEVTFGYLLFCNFRGDMHFHAFFVVFAGFGLVPKEKDLVSEGSLLYLKTFDPFCVCGDV